MVEIRKRQRERKKERKGFSGESLWYPQGWVVHKRRRIGWLRRGLDLLHLAEFLWLAFWLFVYSISLFTANAVFPVLFGLYLPSSFFFPFLYYPFLPLQNQHLCQVNISLISNLQVYPLALLKGGQRVGRLPLLLFSCWIGIGRRVCFYWT